MRLGRLLVGSVLILIAGLTATPTTATASHGTASQATASHATEVPETAMLQPGDIGPGWVVSSDELLGDWNFGYTLVQCAAARWSAPGPVADRERGLTLGTSQPGTPSVGQEVRRYASVADARLALTDVRRNARACPEILKHNEATGEVFGTMRVTVLDRGFAGNGSLLLRETFTAAMPDLEHSTNLRVFVRKGALLTEFQAPDDEAEARRIAVAAAARM